MSWLSSFLGAQREQATSEQATLLDVITYTAGLASNPREIDPTLDKVREISSRLKPRQALSANDEETLTAIYAKLERYLVEQEQIRKFTAEEVRAKVRAKFPKLAAKVSRQA